MFRRQPAADPLVTIDRQLAEAQERKRLQRQAEHHADLVAIRQRQTELAARDERLERERQERELADVAAKNAERERQFRAHHDQVAAWARRRNELHDSAAQLRRDLATAEDRVHGADLADAAVAHGHAAVLRERLSRAEQELDAWVRSQPQGPMR